ncbi:MAG: PRC-barrel domain-containing protein [Anaerolineae bacterium]
MQFKQGTHVYTSDNQDVGTIDRVVLDPQNDEVVGLVVRKGLAVHRR